MGQISIPVNTDSLINFQNYGIYEELVKTGKISVSTNNMTLEDAKHHFKCILNILRDGIETDRVHNMEIYVNFVDDEVVKLSITDYMINLMLWTMPLEAGDPITSEFLFFETNGITGNTIKEYIDEKFIEKHRLDIPFIRMNQIIDDSLYPFKYIDEFAFYFLNTINNEDTINLMNQNKEFYDCIHSDLSNIPIEDIKKVGMEYTNKAINIIKSSDHCLADSFLAKEGISPKQFKEFLINIGSKPDGDGGVWPAIINGNFSNGGLKDIPEYFMESSVGRIALMMQKNNVGDSGHFSRILGLNNRGTTLHNDPNYQCNTRNLERVEIKNAQILNAYKNRWYRLEPNGIEHRMSFTPLKYDMGLIGKTLYFRSPMTCASKARGEGICYRCYGDLAFVNKDINIGKIAAELLCSCLTQMLLSAKHLLESLVRALAWNDNFDELFDVAFNIIGIKEDMNTKGYNLIINTEDIFSEDEYDSAEYNDYISFIEVQCPDGEIKKFNTEDMDNIYISKELSAIINNQPSGLDQYVIPFDSLKDIRLFLIHISNNELSRTLENVKKMINRSADIKSRDRNSLLQDFLEAVINGGINLDAIHAEVLLSNLIRNADDVLEMPDWTIKDGPYRLVTLNEALTNHPSITTSLEYQKIPKTLCYPLSFKKIKSATLDLFFMERPQDLMDIELEDSGIKSDVDKIIDAFKYDKPENAFGYTEE